MTDRLDRLEASLTKTMAGFLTGLRSTKKPTTGTDAMTTQNETVSAVLADLKMLVDSDALERVYARLESALTKAEAVEPVEYQVRFRPIFADAAEMTWSKCTREEYENPKLDSLYDKRALYAHASPAVPAASVPDGSAILQAIDALQEFKPHAQKHPHARKGFVNSMRKKAATCEGDEYGWVNKGDALMAIARVLVTTTPPTNQEGAAP